MNAGIGAAAALLAVAACAVGGTAEQDRGRPVEARRQRMVEDQIRARGIKDPRVLAAMAAVPRHRFVPEAQAGSAYEDTPLPIGEGQTISQPYIVAYMTEALAPAPGARVLEIGTGSGYQAAVLAELVKEVYTIEIVPALAARAARTLKELGYTNVQTREGDGYLGWPERAPFDAVIVTAAPDHVPQPLIDQLRVGGRLVIPVGRGIQDLLVYEKRADALHEIARLPVRFVPLTRKPG